MASRVSFLALLVLALLSACAFESITSAASAAAALGHCKVLIAGGTTAALSAALSSAMEGVTTCILEPTDWIGGQMTASAVSAIDFAWHKLKKGNATLDVASASRDPKNISPIFYHLLAEVVGNPGKCWVSNYCYPPRTMLDTGFTPLLRPLVDSGVLHIYYNTVPKRVRKEGNAIVAVDAVRRTELPRPKDECRMLGEQIEDMYSDRASIYATKELLTFESPSALKPALWTVIDATEWGELLVLSGADYLQGIAEQFDGDTSGKGRTERDEQCGQSVCFGLTQSLDSVPSKEPGNPYPVRHPEWYSLGKHSWSDIWTYRRLVGKQYGLPLPGDLSLQNWQPGNDYPYGYLFNSRAEAAIKVQQDRWDGGVDTEQLREAAFLAAGWHYWFKQANATYGPFVSLDRQALGTCHGLSKMPYIRDTRRSIGVGGFVMTTKDVSGDFTVRGPVGTIYPDRVAIGSYNIDIHPMQGCSYPSYMTAVQYDVLPYFVPYRAMTNRAVRNLLLAGKTMAQSFLVNAATRLHPVEWNSGAAAGAAASILVRRGVDDTAIVLRQAQLLADVQAAAARYTPSRWYINGTYYPPQQ